MFKFPLFLPYTLVFYCFFFILFFIIFSSFSLSLPFPLSSFLSFFLPSPFFLPFPVLSVLRYTPEWHLLQEGIYVHFSKKLWNCRTWIFLERVALNMYTKNRISYSYAPKPFVLTSILLMLLEFSSTLQLELEKKLKFQ